MEISSPLSPLSFPDVAASTKSQPFHDNNIIAKEEQALREALGRSFSTDPVHVHAKLSLNSSGTSSAHLSDQMDTSDSHMSVSTLTNDDHTSTTLMTLQRSILNRNYDEIVRIMRRQEDDVDFTRECCIAIGDLAFADQDCQTRLGQAGACGAVVSGMKTHVNNLGVGFSGLTAITALLLRGNLNNAVLIVQAGGCGVIVSGTSYVTIAHLAILAS